MSFFDTEAANDVTLHGIEKWTCHLYEELGWMTLMNEHNRMDKVASYITSIKKLKLSIDARLKIITNEDSKMDLLSLLSKVKHLYRIANKLFDQNAIKANICEKCAKINDKVDAEHQNELEGGSKSKSKYSKNSKITTTRKSIKKSIDEPLIKKLSKKNSKISKKSSKKSSKKTSKKSSKKQSKIVYRK